ncbi:hypothetical protein MD484_g4109, partial [Candolleomyces efflorescens]
MASQSPVRRPATPSSPCSLTPTSFAAQIKRKLVIVGDGKSCPHISLAGLDKFFSQTGACGKTSLLCSFALGEFPKEYQPTVFDNYVAEIRLDEKPIHLALWDTAGQEEYEGLRPMSYSKSHVILIAFAIDTPDSLENVTHKWNDEVRSICGPVIPVILVGCKADLRPENLKHDNPDVPCPYVTKEQGERVAAAIGARAYKECSALRIEGVDEIQQVHQTPSPFDLLYKNRTWYTAATTRMTDALQHENTS